MTIKQRPTSAPQPTHLWQFDAIVAQTKEHYEKLKGRITGIQKNKEKLQQWQQEINKLQELQASGSIIHTHTWTTKEREKENILVELQHLNIGLDRLQYTVSLSGQKLFSNFEAIIADYHACYINVDQLTGYLNKYQQLLQDTKGVVLFNADAESKIKEAIEKYVAG